MSNNTNCWGYFTSKKNCNNFGTSLIFVISLENNNGVEISTPITVQFEYGKNK